MTGEPAALSALLSPTALFPDLMWYVNLSQNPCIVANNAFWGNGTGVGGAISAPYLVGSIEGGDGGTATTFNRVDVEYSITLNTLSADPTAGNTELTMDVYTGKSKDAYGLMVGSSGATAAQSAIASSTPQKRFDFQLTSPYARFKFNYPDNSGYFEINDYRVRGVLPAGQSPIS